EITPPPNQPNGGLWTAYWSAGRASGVGLESDFIRKVVEAYDMTCAAVDENGEGIYQEEDRIRIERDLLLESTILLVCDKKLNNKSVSNRTAVALVGMCVGHPDLFRFGMEGFSKTVNEWFLQDGTLVGSGILLRLRKGTAIRQVFWIVPGIESIHSTRTGNRPTPGFYMDFSGDCRVILSIHRTPIRSRILDWMRRTWI